MMTEADGGKINNVVKDDVIEDAVLACVGVLIIVELFAHQLNLSILIYNY